jgi:putative FmdB family regulatory protein
MPIYAYRCGSCGFEKDVLQKLSAAPLSSCPKCNAEAFAKQLTAPGFHLKGSGWYATDFKGGAKPAAKEATKEAGPSVPDTAAKTETPAPAVHGSGSCACH